MSIAERIGHWSLRHPDTVLVMFGFVMGVGLANVGDVGLIGMTLSGLLCGLFTFLIGHVEPHALGPHQ